MNNTQQKGITSSPDTSPSAAKVGVAGNVLRAVLGTPVRLRPVAPVGEDGETRRRGDGEGGAVVPLAAVAQKRVVTYFAVGTIEGNTLHGKDGGSAVVDPGFFQRFDLNQEGKYVRYDDGSDAFIPDQAEAVMRNAVAPLVQKSPFTEVVSIKTRMEQLGEVMMKLKQRRELMSHLMLGDDVEQRGIAPPDEAGLGDWLDYMTSLLECEIENINHLIAHL